MTLFIHPSIDILEYGLSLSKLQSLFTLNPLNITWRLKQVGLKVILNGTICVKDNLYMHEDAYTFTDIWHKYPQDITPMLKKMKISIEHKLLVKIQCLSDD